MKTAIVHVRNKNTESIMTTKKLAQLDLNLLKVLKVLIEEKNVTKAADRLHLAQPSVSRQLRKLRDNLDDALFISSPKGLILTPRCEQIAQVLPDLLDAIYQTLSPEQEFDPAKKEGHISLAINPILGQTLPAEIYLLLAKHSPKVTFSCHLWNKYTLENIETDQIYMGIHYDIDVPNKLVVASCLLKDRFKAYVSDKHPLNKQSKITINDLSHYPITTAILPNWNDRKGLLERLFELEGLTFTKGFSSEVISNISKVVSETDSIFPVSELYIEPHQNLTPIYHDRLPKIEPRNILLYSNYKYRNDPYFQWLQEQITTLIQQIINHE